MTRICEGRVVVVTGAGRGIGRAYALAMARAGAAVVVNDLGVSVNGESPSSEPSERVAGEIIDCGGQATASAHDVTTDDGARGLVEHALDHFGRLHAVVNNAGILRSGLLLWNSAADWRAVLDVHLIGTFLVSQAAARYWREQAKAGTTVDARIVNTTSTAGLYGFVGEAPYSAAKAGVAGFTLTAAAELSRYGVSVNAVAPAALTRLTAWAEAGLGRQAALATAELVAPLAVWLVSPLSAGVTGRVFDVGGGHVAVLDGWRPGRPVDHGPDPDWDDLDRELRDRMAKAAPAVPAFVPAPNERSE